jgi:hypothetical protein
MLELMRIDVPTARFAKVPKAPETSEPATWIDVLT